MSIINISKPLVSMDVQYDADYSNVLKAKRALANLFSIGKSDEAAKDMYSRIAVYYRGYVVSGDEGYELARVDKPVKVNYIGKSNFALELGTGFAGWAVEIPPAFDKDGRVIEANRMQPLSERCKVIIADEELSFTEDGKPSLGISTAEFFLCPDWFDSDYIFGHTNGIGVIDTATLWPEWYKEVTASLSAEEKKAAEFEKIGKLPEVVALATMKARIAELAVSNAEMLDKVIDAQTGGLDELFATLVAELAPITKELKDLRMVQLPLAEAASELAIAVANGADPSGFDITGARKAELRAMTKANLVTEAEGNGLTIDGLTKTEIVTVIYRYEADQWLAEKLAGEDDGEEAEADEEPEVEVKQTRSEKRAQAKAEREAVAA